jgi:hypothetical protein
MIRFGIFLILGCLAATTTCYAQETGAPRRDFFEKDFAKSPLETGAKPKQAPVVPGGPAPINPQEMQRLQAEAEKMQQQGMDQLFKDPAMKKWMKEFDGQSEAAENTSVIERKVQEATLEEELPEPTRTLAVNSIGLIVNSMEREHYQRALQGLLHIADTREIKISSVYTLGNFEIATRSSLIPGVVARGGVVRVLNEIPEGYEVTLSPTYIVKTPEGEIVLEAVSSLERYFSSSGEFLDRQPRKLAPAAKPAANKPTSAQTPAA